MSVAVLDTNVYYIGLTRLRTNSAIIMRNLHRFIPILTPYITEETTELFRRLDGKDSVGLIMTFFGTMDAIKVEREDILPLLSEYSPYAADKDDIPHICAYFASDGEYFVTTNRRLTRMKIREMVNFTSPKEFVETLGLRGLETVDGI